MSTEARHENPPRDAVTGPLGAIAALAFAAAVSSWIAPLVSAGAGEMVVLTLVALAAAAAAVLRAGDVRRSAAAIATLWILLAVAAGLSVHSWFLAHELPEPVVGSVARLWSLAGLETVVVGEGIVSISHPTGWIDTSVTIEKLGHVGLGALALWAVIACARGRASIARRSIALVLAMVLLGLGSVVRLGVLTIIDTDLGWTGLYWMPWIEFLTFAPIAALIGLTTRALAASSPATGLAGEAADETVEHDGARPRRLTRPVMVAVSALAGVAASAALFLDPPGERSGGRVLIDDAHSDWAWADGRFDETAFGERRVYTYNSLVRLLGHFWEVDINHEERIDAALLEGVDVLVLKMPTRPYDEDEIDAVEAYVRAGGGLWLIGDHTNLFGSSTYLNRLSSRFGMRFRNDDQFELTTGGPTRIASGRASAASLWANGADEIRDLTFLTSCTIEAPVGAAELIGFGMCSEPGEYSHVNFFGNIRADRDEMFGAFAQQASVNVGRGRVTAFADSTVFSDFCIWDDVKSALAVHTIDRLNRDRGPAVGPLVSALGAAAGPAVLLALIAGAVAAGFTWLSGPAMAVSVAGATMLFGLVSQTSMPEPRTPLEHVRIHQDISGALFPTFLQWEPEMVYNPNAFDQFALCWNRVGIAPLRTSVLPTGGDPVAEILLLPVPERVTPEVAHDLHERLRAGGRLIIVAESGARMQRLALSSLLDTFGVEHRAVAIPTPAFPHAPGAIEHPLGVGVDRAGRIEITDADEMLVMPSSGLWFQTITCGEGELVVIDGATALSRRAAGMTFKQATDLEMALAELTMGLQRVIVGQQGERRLASLRPIAARVESLWQDAPELASTATHNANDGHDH